MKSNGKVTYKGEKYSSNWGFSFFLCHVIQTRIRKKYNKNFSLLKYSISVFTVLYVLTVAIAAYWYQPNM